MKIEIHGELEQSQVESLFNTKVKTLEIAPDCIAKVIIASSDSDYGDSIKSSKGFTGGKTHSEGAVGKTLPFHGVAGKVVSDIIFPYSTIQTVLEGDSEDVDMLDYVLSHELGHCSDYFTRELLQCAPLADFSVGIEDLAEYWAPLTLEEFAASFIAGPDVTTKQHDMIVENSLSGLISGMKNQDSYGFQLFWYILCEEAKVIGTSIGDVTHLKKDKFCIWEGINDNVLDQLRLYADELHEIHGNYPAWNADTHGVLTDRCLSLFDAMES